MGYGRWCQAGPASNSEATGSTATDIPNTELLLTDLASRAVKRVITVTLRLQPLPGFDTFCLGPRAGQPGVFRLLIVLLGPITRRHVRTRRTRAQRHKDSPGRRARAAATGPQEVVAALLRTDVQSSSERQQMQQAAGPGVSRHYNDIVAHVPGWRFPKEKSFKTMSRASRDLTLRYYHHCASIPNLLHDSKYLANLMPCCRHAMQFLCIPGHDSE